ncbi:MAG: sensor histidine kinase [Lachnospiraceae bacterium]|nr:sensor histidine kinase [Lachnospiraceae bacterium]
MWLVNSFHIQILLIELLFCWHLPRRSHFWLRLLLGGGLYVASLYLIPGGYFSPFLRIGWFTFGFLTMLLLSAALLWLCFDILPKQLVFYCCVAHTLQHIVHCLGRVLTFSLSISSRSIAGQVALFVILLIVMWLGYYLFLKQTKGSETADIKNTALLLFAVASSLIIYVLSYWTTSRETDTIGVELFDAFSCMLLLGILLDTFRYSRAERENLVMMHVLRQEQAQHEMSRATVEVINRKCHDLKHQISALRSMDNPEEKERSIRDLEQSVMIYDRFVKSGNRDLDIILAEKNLLCEEKGIELHGILDGEKLSFIKTEDLYSLMGNALDNAIEAVSEEEEGKRIITLRVSAQGRILFIHVENPCSKKPLFENGLPLTTKSDQEYHGFGMRSMRYVAEKYEGALQAGWEDGAFCLDIVLPLPESKDTTKAM